MPSPQSLYHKIQVVLETARSSKPESLADLQDSIRDPVFHTRQYDSDRDTIVNRRSQKVVRRTVNLCRDLELIDSEGGLTATGRAALRRGAFDGVVAIQVRDVLRSIGVSTVSLNTAIRRALKDDPPVLPTAAYLWESVGAEMGAGQFSRMMTLLTACGGARTSRQKVFTLFES